MGIKYKAAGKAVRDAWYEWKKSCGEQTHCLASFAAGFNAAKAEDENKISELEEKKYWEST